MNAPIIPRWAPRLARLYSADIRKLETVHAGRIFRGAATWGEAIDAIYQRMRGVGPAKAARMIRQAADYLGDLEPDQRAYLILSSGGRSRNAHLIFATFSTGNHPDLAVHEEGVSIEMYALRCSRVSYSRLAGDPVSFVSRHALKRLYERDFDITENSHAHSALACIAIAGLITHKSEHLADSALYLRFSEVLLAGGLHDFPRTDHRGLTYEARIYDVRTALEVAEIGPSKQHQLDQGEITASAVFEWFRDDDDLDEATLADRILFLPKREDNFSAQIAARRQLKTEPADPGNSRGG